MDGGQALLERDAVLARIDQRLVEAVAGAGSLLLLEGPILAFTIAPERTPAAIENAKDWVRAHGRVYGARGLAFIGFALVVKALIELL